MVIAVQKLKMTQNRNYAVFILSHGRPDNVITYRVLRDQGYTGKIFIICDDEDKKLNEYKSKYKDEVIVFSKSDYQNKFDLMDNFTNNKVIVYARNACYDIARKLELDYFFEYEDDYTYFSYRYAEGESLKAKKIKNIGVIFNLMIDCLEETKINTIAFAQAGEFLGGVKKIKTITYKRKAMNTFVFKVNKDPKDDIIFIGRMNDDVNTYLTQGAIGKLFFQITKVCLVQVQTQLSEGGNTEIYKSFGTYVKSFYSVIAAPSCCKIDVMRTRNKRIHHKITWVNAVPKILHQKWRK